MGLRGEGGFKRGLKGTSEGFQGGGFKVKRASRRLGGLQKGFRGL